MHMETFTHVELCTFIIKSFTPGTTVGHLESLSGVPLVVHDKVGILASWPERTKAVKACPEIVKH